MPYFGAGAGVARLHDPAGGDDGVQTVLSLGAGVRVGLSEQLFAVLDARLRPPLDGEADEAHTDVTLGLRYLLRRPDRPRFRGAP